MTEESYDYLGKFNITGKQHNTEIVDRIMNERREFRKETIGMILGMADQKKVWAISEGKSLVDGVGQYKLSETTQVDPNYRLLQELGTSEFSILQMEGSKTKRTKKGAS